MASYYYLIASLPDLKSDGEMPITYQQFLDMCENAVSAKTYQALKDLDLSSEEGPVVKNGRSPMGHLHRSLTISVVRDWARAIRHLRLRNSPPHR